MKQLLRNLKISTVLILSCALFLLLGVVWQQYQGQQKLLSASGYNKAGLADAYARAGTIYSREGTALAYSDFEGRHYALDEELQASCLQWLGDYTHNMTNTLEMAYQKQLCGQGRAFWEQLKYDFKGQSKQGDELRLTVSASLNQALYRLLQPYRAAGLVLDLQSGEVLAMVSTPSTAIRNVLEWQDIPDSALFNRVLQAQYTPGSTFKLVTETAWMRSPSYDPELTVSCLGTSGVIGDGSAHELRADAGHGTVNAEQAMAYSCNHFFARVALTAGASALQTAAEHLGFNQDQDLDRLWVQKSRYSLEPVDDFVLSWQAVGQGIGESVLTVSPLHLAQLAQAAALDGQALKAHLVKQIIGPDGQILEQAEPERWLQMWSPEEAAVIRRGMEASVNEGLASALQIPGWRIGAKTGTAQATNVDGQEQTLNLLTAYALDEAGAGLAMALVVEAPNIVNVSALAAQVLNDVGNFNLP